MTRNLCLFVAACGLLVGALFAEAAFAQKQGGILRVYHWDSPPSMSIHEEATISTVVPMMGVFNNLVIYQQNVPQNSLQSITPDLATSWTRNEDSTALTFQLQEGVKWHDGSPFTASDVACTWNMLTGNSNVSLRTNPRKSWYQNLERVTADSDNTVTFHLRRPQPAFIALLASGFSPVYPCHVSPRDMRQHPIGTGPFKFVEFKPNESIKLTRNPDYWKSGRPYLDGIEYTVVPNRLTAVLGFIAEKFDMTWPYNITIPVLKDVQTQAPRAICELRTTNSRGTLIFNRNIAPFDDPDVRRAIMLALDRKGYIDILAEGQAKIGGVMMPPPEGIWGMPTELLNTLPGYDSELQNNRTEARKIMQKVGYGPDRHLSVKFATRNIPVYRDAAVILSDQLREIYIDSDLDVIESTNWFSKLARKDYQVGFEFMGGAVDDPDAIFYQNYGCSGELNYTGYCSRDVERMLDEQSMEVDQEKRRNLIWEIEKKLANDAARPIIHHTRAATCWQPKVKGLTTMVNSIFNGWRMEGVWLDN
jgi:peptide/nickel transport system substrate-binding protein